MPNALKTIEVGAVFEFPYPFVREVYDDGDPEGGGPSPCWKPGVRFEERVIYGYGGEPDMATDCVADGTGKQRVTVVGVYKPGRFPTRVFFERRWIDPDGREFGKGGCKTKVISAFRSLICGYAHHIDRITNAPPLAPPKPIEEFIDPVEDIPW